MERNNIYAVIDTNVLVSALLSSDGKSNPLIVLQSVLVGNIIPVFNEEILSEYEEVLSRDKLHLQKQDIDYVINHIRRSGLVVDRTKTIDEVFPDPKDIVFYEVALSKESAYLVTGNIKHFPQKPFVVTPAEMVEILGLSAI